MLDARNTFYSVKRLLGRPFASDEVRRARERFAFELAASDNGGTVVKTRGETYALSEISAFVLRELRRIAEAATGKRCSQAVITVPANFSDLQRNATMAAGRVAGLEVLRVLNEPTAAALAYGYGKQGRERVAVFDMGGGTFDVSILELSGEVFEVIGTAGDSYLGGDDIDGAIADVMAEEFLRQHRMDPRTDPESFERLRAAAEWAKCELTDQDEVELRVEELAHRRGGAGARPALHSHAACTPSDCAADHRARLRRVRDHDACGRTASESARQRDPRGWLHPHAAGALHGGGVLRV
jgi:molecular chaperone DnaK